MCFGRRNFDFFDTFRTCQEFCELLTHTSDPLENLLELWRAISYLGRPCGAHRASGTFWCSLQGALRRLLDLCTTFLDIKEHGGCFLKLCKGEKASLTCWNFRGHQQSTAKCSDPQRSLLNLGQHERIPENLAVHWRTSENRCAPRKSFDTLRESFENRGSPQVDVENCGERQRDLKRPVLRNLGGPYWNGDHLRKHKRPLRTIVDLRESERSSEVWDFERLRGPREPERS